MILFFRLLPNGALDEQGTCAVNWKSPATGEEEKRRMQKWGSSAVHAGAPLHG